MHPRSSGQGFLPRYGGGWMHQFGHVYALQQELLNPDANNWFRAAELWHTARHEGIAMNVSHYRNALRQCVRPGAWEQALRFLSQMERDNIRPDVNCVSNILATCVEGKRPQEVEEVFKTYSQEMMLDSVCYLALIRSRVESGRPVEAVEAGRVQETQGVPFLPHTYTHLLEAASEATNAQYAFELVRRMHSEQWLPTPHVRQLVLKLAKSHGMEQEFEAQFEPNRTNEGDSEGGLLT
ncbi:unnamed protein product [Phytomonas sp. EM1]|nr:unnamed protein product [Phytomonas sp. EM1]|eukprot:CCW62655.1 unnamed protein product [Phytomonas sp. isolate EM1]